MDLRTAQILEALDAAGVSLLVELLARPCTEHELLATMQATTQPTANRRLDRLARAGLIERATAKPHTPGRVWRVVHPAETEALLTALLAVSEAVDARDQARRAEERRKLARARAARLGIREAGSERA